MKKFFFSLVLAAIAPIASLSQTCDASLWKHVYNPQRLRVVNPCVTARGTAVDATKGKRKDGVRHEADGDPHGWLKLDPGQESLLLPGNTEAQSGNIVYEAPCMFRVTQADAKSACRGYKNAIKLPRVGDHVCITGALIEDLDHQPIHREIHPVTKIEACE